MNFTQLMAFEAVVRNGSVTKAAQLLRVSQPSVSKHLKNLEEHYRVKLFEKNAGTMQLTDAGRILRRRVDAILFHLNKLENEFNTVADSSKSEPLKIAGSSAASALVIPSAVAIFKRNHQETPIILRTGSTINVKKMLLNSEVEIALINQSPVNPNLVSEPFRKEKLVVFATPHHPLARQKTLTFADLNGAPLVAIGGKGTASTIEKILRTLPHQGPSLKIAIRCGTPEAVKAIVKKGLGVGLMFQDAVLPEIRKKVFKRLKFPGLRLFGQSYIVYYNRPLSPHAREFLALLRKKAHHGSQKLKPAHTPDRFYPPRRDNQNPALTGC